MYSPKDARKLMFNLINPEAYSISDLPCRKPQKTMSFHQPRSEKKVEEWRSTMASRLDEAAATLQDEDVQVESWFTLEMEGNKYLLWYLRAKSIKRVFEVLQKLKHPIDRFHVALMAEITADDGNIIAQPLIDIPRRLSTL